MLPLFTKCNVCIIWSIWPIECLCSIRCWANFELPLPNLKSLKCSRYLTRNFLPVCPTYFMLQSMHVNWYMPHLLNLSVFEVMLCWAKILRIVFWVLYATLILVLRKILVIYLVCLSVHVKVAHFVFCCFLRAVDNSGCRRTNPPPPTNTNHKHNHNCQPHALLLFYYYNNYYYYY